MVERATYEVGKGKPPKHTRFGAGSNANPNGKTSAQKKAEMAQSEARAILMSKLLSAASQVEADGSVSEIMDEAKIAMASYGVPIDKSLVRNAVDYFGGMKELQVWATRTLSAALADMGVDVSKLKARSQISQNTRYKVFERAGFKCQACGAKPSKVSDVTLHVDHIIPVSLGGGGALKNLQCLCAECNTSKGNKSVFDHNQNW